MLTRAVICPPLEDDEELPELEEPEDDEDPDDDELEELPELDDPELLDEPELDDPEETLRYSPHTQPVLPLART